MKAAPTWNHKQKIPSREEFAAHMAGQGLDAGHYDEWVARVELVKANNAAEAAAKRAKGDTASGEAPAAPAVPRAPAAPTAPVAPPVPAAPAIAALPHRAARPEPIPTEVMSVRVRAGIGARLDMYRAKHRATKQEVVSDVLDAFLTGQGF